MLKKKPDDPRPRLADVAKRVQHHRRHEDEPAAVEDVALVADLDLHLAPLEQISSGMSTMTMATLSWLELDAKNGGARVPVAQKSGKAKCASTSGLSSTVPPSRIWSRSSGSPRKSAAATD